ncbi:MAG: FAD-dependent oxidoreductase [Oscillospiraceae bacterium]|nr:FAD-dependent oxidoreductase [Oscillospiraceae bacterium]
MAYEKLFAPIKVRGLDFDSRMIMTAMGSLMATEHGDVNDRVINYLTERAKNGGFVFTECCSVYPGVAQDFALHVSDDKYIEGLKKLTDSVHAAGGKIGIQLYHPAEALTNSHYDSRKVRMMAPDTLFGIPGTRVETEEIPYIIECFGEGARRAVEAGFDAIEIHNGHNYILHQFLSPHFNHRDDGWGGSVENCRKFPLAVVEAVRKNMPEDMPLFIRVSAGDDELYDKEGNFDGLTLDDMLVFLEEAKKRGVDVIDVSRGNFQTDIGLWECPNLGIPHGFNVERALIIKEKIGLPVVAVGRLGTPDLAEEVLTKGADFVAWGHAHIADPEIVKKTKEGRVDEIRYCIGCDEGCNQAYNDATLPHVSCMRNPAAGREGDMPMVPAAEPKKVLVAGGGPAGLEAARVLAERGHKVVLCDAADKLGGQFNLASVAPMKGDFALAVKQMIDWAVKAGVEVKLNTPVTKEVIAEIKPDYVVNAIGSSAAPCAIPGAEHAVSAHDVMAGKVELKGNVVVIGGGCVGMETAMLAADKQQKGEGVTSVTGIEKKAKYAADGATQVPSYGRAQVWRMWTAGKTEVHNVPHPVKQLANTTVEEIKEGAVVAHTVVKRRDRATKQMVVVKDEVFEVAADTIVYATGAVQNDSSAIVAACEELGIPCEAIGSAKKLGHGVPAILDGATIGRKI